MFDISKLLASIVLLALAFAFGPDTPRREKLDRPSEIQGYLCAAGWAWFHPYGQLRSCTVDRDTPFGEAIAPAKSWIELTGDGTPRFLVVSHDTSIAGHLCRGGGFGGPEGYTTAFYPSGKLKLCWLAGDQIVQGIPCAGATFWGETFGGGFGTYFYENGQLRGCKLSKNFAGLKKGERITRNP